MTTKLDIVDLDFTKEVISIALAKSADSLSFFLNEKVLLHLEDIKFNADTYFPLVKKKNKSNSYLLTTHIRGDFKGKAYLIFNESEVDRLLAANFPASVRDNPTERVKVINDFLLEIDNIISASVITQFANLLKHNIYGDVPKLDVVQSDLLNEYLEKQNSGEGDLKIFYFNTRFITKHMEVSPEFVWLLEDSFFNNVNQLLGNENKINLYDKLKATRS